MISFWFRSVSPTRSRPGTQDRRVGHALTARGGAHAWWSGSFTSSSAVRSPHMHPTHCYQGRFFLEDLDGKIPIKFTQTISLSSTCSSYPCDLCAPAFISISRASFRSFVCKHRVAVCPDAPTRCAPACSPRAASSSPKVADQCPTCGPLRHQTHTHTHTCIYININISTDICIYVCIHTHTHTHTHNGTQTHLIQVPTSRMSFTFSRWASPRLRRVRRASAISRPQTFLAALHQPRTAWCCCRPNTSTQTQ
jgi:hypothetical protein